MNAIYWYLYLSATIGFVLGGYAAYGMYVSNDTDDIIIPLNLALSFMVGLIVACIGGFVWPLFLPIGGIGYMLYRLDKSRNRNDVV